MKKLREEILKAKEAMNDAMEQYLKKDTKQNYDWLQYCKRYLEGLQKAFDLIEGE